MRHQPALTAELGLTGNFAGLSNRLAVVQISGPWRRCRRVRGDAEQFDLQPMIVVADIEVEQAVQVVNGHELTPIAIAIMIDSGGAAGELVVCGKVIFCQPCEGAVAFVAILRAGLIGVGNEQIEIAPARALRRCGPGHDRAGGEAGWRPRMDKRASFAGRRTIFKTIAFDRFINCSKALNLAA